MQNDSSYPHIGFNKPYMTGNELEYIKEAVGSGKISGDGIFTRKCHRFFEEKYGFKKALLTTSCTDALELAAMLLNIKPGDEVIAPSYTFVSTVNAFLLRGAKIVFADSRPDHPNMDADKLSNLITDRTKAILPVHYAGNACDMDVIMDLAEAHNLFVVEDAAQAIDSFYKGKPLGSIGHLGAFSFHETKNVISGEGGMLTINDEQFSARAEIIREKGTNRSAFFRGEVDKYGWVDIGSSFLPSEIIAAFLFAQLEKLEVLQRKRIEIWNFYYSQLEELELSGKIIRPVIPSFATNNAHMFYMICKDLDERTALLQSLKNDGINAVFHYLSLHKSKFYLNTNPETDLPWADFYTDRLVRLPFYYELTESDLQRIVNAIRKFYGLKSD